MAEVIHNPPFCSIKGQRRGDKSIELTIIQHAQTDPAANGDLSESNVCQQIHQLEEYRNDNLKLLQQVNLNIQTNVTLQII